MRVLVAVTFLKIAKCFFPLEELADRPNYSILSQPIPVADVLVCAFLGND